MFAGLFKNCIGMARPFCETLFLAGIFYVMAADQYAALRPEVVDHALTGYRAAVDDVLMGKFDVGDLDRQVIMVVAELHPAPHYETVKANIEREVHIVFDAALN